MGSTAHLRFYRSQSIADEVFKRLHNLGVQATIECACISDSHAKNCEYGSGPCYNGLYISVPQVYSEMLHTITNQVERGD